MPPSVADLRCLWCEHKLGFDAEDQVWYHSDTGKVRCADDEHDADDLAYRPSRDVLSGVERPPQTRGAQVVPPNVRRRSLL